MKRIVTLQDISCIGGCSITIALPIISAMGVECGILPTAILSTHTMFEHFTSKDLSDQIDPIADVWEAEGITFDGISTGYLASEEQCMQIGDFIDRFASEDTTVIIDPVMADHGKLYPSFDENFPAAMAKLCGKAQVIVPNITEASLLTGMPYKTTYDAAYIDALLEGLLELGCETAVITGVSYEADTLGVAALSKDGSRFEYYTPKHPKTFHGTGDAYAAVLIGALMRGLDIGESLKLATDFVVGCIEHTAKANDARWYTVDFQSQIPWLCAELQKYVKD